MKIKYTLDESEIKQAIAHWMSAGMPPTDFKGVTILVWSTTHVPEATAVFVRAEVTK